MILQMREMGHIPGAWGSKVGIGSNTSQAWWDSLQTRSDFFYVLLRYRFQWWLQGIVLAYKKEGGSIEVTVYGIDMEILIKKWFSVKAH